MDEGTRRRVLGREESGTMIIGQWKCTHVRERSQREGKKARAQEGSSSDPPSFLESILHHNKLCCRGTSMGGWYGGAWDGPAPEGQARKIDGELLS